MKQHSPSHVGDGENGPFCNPILVVCVHTAILDTLILFVQVLNKGIGFKYSIVGKIVCDDHSIAKSKLFIVLFGPNGLSAREPKLMLDVDVPTHVVDEDTPTHIMFGCGLSK